MSSNILVIIKIASFLFYKSPPYSFRLSLKPFLFIRSLFANLWQKYVLAKVKFYHFIGIPQLFEKYVKKTRTIDDEKKKDRAGKDWEAKKN